MTRRHIDEILAAHRDRLLEFPGVVGIGRGERDGAPCVVVMTADAIPEVLRQLPDDLEGYLVEVRETGELHAVDPDTHDEAP